MKQFSASLNYQSSLLDGAARADDWSFAKPTGILLQKDQGLLSYPKDFTRISDLRGVALHPWVKVSDFREQVEAQQASDAQTARAVEDAVAAERNRLARELHDAVTQTLFAASLIAEVLPDLWDMDEAEAHRSTEELRQLTRGALAEMRTLLFELRPAALNQARLPDLLKQLSEAVMGRKRLPIRLDVVGD